MRVFSVHINLSSCEDSVLSTPDWRQLRPKPRNPSTLQCPKKKETRTMRSDAIIKTASSPAPPALPPNRKISVTTTETTGNNNWLPQIPQILDQRHLFCIQQTPSSAKEYISQSEESRHFVDGETIPFDVEETLFEAFIEDDYDGKLHLTTIHDQRTNGGDNDNEKQKQPLQQQPLGIIFWREVPPEEMYEWINFDQLGIQLENLMAGEHKDKDKHEKSSSLPLSLPSSLSSRPMQRDDTRKVNTTSLTKSSREIIELDNTNNNPKLDHALTLVRQTSCKSLAAAVAIATTSTSPTVVSSSTSLTSSIITKSPPNTTINKEEVTQAWIKIELLAVHKQYWGKGIGSLLLACGMHEAYMGYNNDATATSAMTNSITSSGTKPHHNNKRSGINRNRRIILHIAGGVENVPATRLYTKFGFVPASSSGVFHKPNKDIYVLGNIGEALQTLPWNETLQKEREMIRNDTT